MNESSLEKRNPASVTGLEQKALTETAKSSFLAEIRASRENALPELRKLLSARLKKMLFSSEEKESIKYLARERFATLSLKEGILSEEEKADAISKFRTYFRAAEIVLRKGDVLHGSELLAELVSRYLVDFTDIIPSVEVDSLMKLSRLLARVLLLRETGFYRDLVQFKDCHPSNAFFLLESTGELVDIPLMFNCAGSCGETSTEINGSDAINVTRIRACVEPAIAALSPEELEHWSLPKERNSKQLTQLILNLLNAMGISTFLSHYTFLGLLGKGSPSDIVHEFGDRPKLEGLLKQRLEMIFSFTESNWPCYRGEHDSKRFFEERKFLERKHENNFKCTLTAHGQQFVEFLMTKIGKVLDEMAGNIRKSQQNQLEAKSMRSLTG